jgi:threonylcarbamoyladenosine tRNA methylthiotransferase MtaB
MKSFSIQTFGCRVNQAEAFLWADELQKQGWRFEKDSTRSDLVLMNTCTLTQSADRDARKFIRSVSRSNPNARMIVTGCYAQRSPEDFRGLPQVWKVLSNAEKLNLVSQVSSCLSHAGPEPLLPFRSRALVKIQDGCDFRCTFCIIPQVRGQSRSVSQEKILSQIREQIDQGFKEIVLTGIHLCSYGQDFDPPSSLLDLLRKIENLDGSTWVRLSSLDPRYLSLPFLEHMTKSEKICPHFHLSLQTGSDRILGLMGRKIRGRDFERILAYIRNRDPFAALGTDIIVGFPGECEDDFTATYEFLTRSPLTYFHVFTYSPRPLTEAASWSQVDTKVKKERAARLRKLAGVKNLAFRKQCLGREFPGIVIKREKDHTQVLTNNYIKVRVPSSRIQERSEVEVRITKVTPKLTEGKIIRA